MKTTFNAPLFAKQCFTFAVTESQMRDAKAHLLSLPALSEKQQIEADVLVVGLIEKHYAVKATVAEKGGKLSGYVFEKGSAAQKRHSRTRMLITGVAQKQWAEAQAKSEARKGMSAAEKQKEKAREAGEVLAALIVEGNVWAVREAKRLILAVNAA